MGIRSTPHVRTEPTPVPTRIEDRVKYEFSVSIEGAIMSNPPTTYEEGEALACAVRGVLHRAFPDRWTSASVSKLPDPIQEGGQ